MSLAFEYEIFTSIRLLHYADDRQDSGNETLNYDHFDYKLNTTICPDATVCPQNFFSTADNTTCCDNHQGKTEINYHNDAVIPIAASDLPGTLQHSNNPLSVCPYAFRAYGFHGLAHQFFL